MEKPHKRLEVWKSSMELVIGLYKATEKFPLDERYGLTTQIRRAALSVPSNIAEGAARRSRKEFLNFLHIAQGSISELDTQLEAARRLDYLSIREWEEYDARLNSIDKMLAGLIRHQRAGKGNK